MSASPWLFAAQAAFSIASEINDYNDGVEAAYIDFANKRRQAAFNNRLAYNALLNTNEQEQLFQKKHALDKFQLNKNIQRAIASRMALQGSAQKSGGSADSVLRNIEAQGLWSLHRKDLNYAISLRNLQIKRDNIALETEGKNNALYSQLRGAPSATGLALSIGGTALQSGVEYKKGRASEVQQKYYEQRVAESSQEIGG